jgi:hypothetical protein
MPQLVQRHAEEHPLDGMPELAVGEERRDREGQGQRDDAEAELVDGFHRPGSRSLRVEDPAGGSSHP